MNVTICIATYGETKWQVLADTRALPSAQAQGAVEILVGHQPEGIISTSRNGLAERATGDWLCFLDADDEFAPGYLDAMRQAYERERDAASLGDLLLTPAVSYAHNGRRRPARFLPGTDLRKNNYLVLGTLVHRDLFWKVGGFSDYPHGFEDWSLWSKCYRAGARIVQVKRAVYIAHVNLNSKHRVAWKNRRWQVEMHNKVAAELDEWETALA